MALFTYIIIGGGQFVGSLLLGPAGVAVHALIILSENDSGGGSEASYFTNRIHGTNRSIGQRVVAESNSRTKIARRHK